MRSESLSGIEGVRWVPEAPTGTAVLVLAGSSGRIDSDQAELLARHGAIAESVRWFGGSGQNAAALLVGAHSPLVSAVAAFAPSTSSGPGSDQTAA